MSKAIKEAVHRTRIPNAHDSGVAGTQRRAHDDNLYPHRAEHDAEGSQKSAGFLAASAISCSWSLPVCVMTWRSAIPPMFVNG